MNFMDYNAVYDYYTGCACDLLENDWELVP